jgi:DNA-binding CsgD family transcriptional regulator
MTLLERHTQLAELVAAQRDAAAGRGSVLLVIGEAGAGKTSLLQQFAADHEAGVTSARSANARVSQHSQVRWGWCDELMSPRPLGPFRDMFGWLGGDDDGRPGPVTDLLGSVVAELDRPPHPAVIIVEDAHWADAATLDVVRFIGRRIRRLRALLIVSYRDDEVPADHPLRLTLGAIPPDDVRRVRLPPLSIDAVARLADRSDVDELYALTGGNPFYVREVLAAPDTEVPPTVQDAVMARVGRLSAAARGCVEVAAAVPGPAEPWLLAGCGVADGVDEAVRLGVLTTTGDTVSFGHELARRAVEQGLPEARRQEINGRILDLLIGRDADPARLTHHAVLAGRTAAVAMYAPIAARRAMAVRSYREAFDDFARALEHADGFAPDALLELLEGYVEAAIMATLHDDAHEAAVRAIAICRDVGDQPRLGRLLTRLSNAEWARGHGNEAEVALAEAITVLEGVPSGDLVAAYAARAKLAMLDHRSGEAITWGERAIALAARHDSDRADRNGTGRHATDAMVTVGSAHLQRDLDDTAPLIDALQVALNGRDVHAAARAYVNLADDLILGMRYDAAQPYIDDGLAYLEAHDEMPAIDHMLAVRARWHLEQGEWAAAEQNARRVPGLESGGLVIAELVLALVQLRRGDPQAGTTLELAAVDAERTTEAQHVVPAALARAEMAWLADDLDGVAMAVRPVIDIVRESGIPRWLGEAALWRHRMGQPDETYDGVPEPYALLIAGDWQGAAAGWAKIGRPYDQADALASAPDPEPQLEALEILDQLGAVPRAAMIRRRLGDLGVTAIPRGPRTSTLASPAGLTMRQTEVLALLAEKLTYQEIADRLQVSIKTVDHHVAAVRTKLDVNSRDDAVLAGRRLGIVPPEDGADRNPR